MYGYRLMVMKNGNDAGWYNHIVYCDVDDAYNAARTSSLWDVFDVLDVRTVRL